MTPEQTALVLIDVQKAFLIWEDQGMKRNNPDAVSNIALLLEAFRAANMPIFHIRHVSKEDGSALAPDQPGFEPMEEARETGDETVIVKHVNASFIGTDLEERLRAHSINTIVIAGITTNHCVETTTRMAGNLGFDARLVADACYTFDRTGPDGTLHTAEAIHAMTLTNLNEEFATIENTQAIATAIHARNAA